MYKVSPFSSKCPHQHAVEEGGHVCRRLERAVGVERRRGPHYVIALPLDRFAVRVDRRGRSFVDAGGLSVDIRLVVIGIEHLKFVSGVTRAGGGRENTAIAAGLPRAGDVLGTS